MAALNDSDSNLKTLQIEEQFEGEHISTSDYYFCKVGASIPIMSDNATFDSTNPPSIPVVLSQRSGLIFAAHSSGFCVAKIKDVMAGAKEIKDKGSGPSVQELSVVDVVIGRVSILALSTDSSVVSAVVGGEIHCFFVDSLLNKDKKPTFSCSVESNHVKDIFWIKEMESSFIILTDTGELYLGAINKSVKHVMDEVDAVGRSVDGKFVAVASKNNLSVFSSKCKMMLQISLPTDAWTGESDTIKVDSIRWVSANSIVVGCFQQNEDGMEENYFVQVIMSKDGTIMDDSPKLTSVNISDLFLGIVDDIVPYGCGPHLFINYLENCEFAFVSNRKNTDQHIMLFDWSQGDNRVSVLDFERDDNWIPRIELQENGDDNLVLGLCVDESSVYENVKVKVGDEEERELSPHCLLVCITLEGKLVLFNVASISGSQRSSRALSDAAIDAPNTSLVRPSDHGEATLQLEEERAKQSALGLGLHESAVKKISSALDEVPVRKDQKPFEQNEYTPGTPHFDQNIRKELVAGNSNHKAGVDVSNSKPSGHLGQSREETANHSLKKFQEGLNFVTGDTVVTENRKIERGVSLADKSLEKNSTDKGVKETIESGEVNSSSTPSSSGGSLGFSRVSNVRPSFPSPVFSRSTLSGSPLSSTEIANSSARFTGNFGSRPSDLFSSSAGKAANHSQNPITTGGLSGMTLGFPGSKLQLQESGKPQNFTKQSVHPTPGNDKKSSPLGQLNSEPNLSTKFSNVQKMANELDKLLESIEAAGGFRDICTTANRSSLKALEEGIDSLSERNRAWQSCTEERLREVQLLLDKTVQVLARKTHMEGIVRQTTDGQYWDLWNRQKLNSELDQKRNSVLNQSQDLINRMIELEKHFNTLELNLYGESSGVNLVSRTRNSRSVPSRHSQSLHAIHNATISQLAAAKQLSDSLSKQMAVLSIKSPPTKQANVKRQVFESIGIPYPDDSLCSPTTSNRKSLVSCSGETRNGSKKIQLSGVSSHDPETARRRRDSLDRNWANFEAPKTTVKRVVVQNERQRVGGLFSSMHKQFVSPGKLEGSITTSKVLALQDRNERKDAPQYLNTDTAATSKFMWSGGVPKLSQAGIEQPPRWKLLQGDNFSATQSMSTSSCVDVDMKKGHILSTAARQGTQIENNGRTDSSGAASADTKPSVLQFGEAKSTPQKIQPKPFSFTIKGGQASTSGSEETEFTKPLDGQSFADVSTSKQDIGASPSVVLPPVSSSSSSMQPLPVTSVEDGSTTSSRIAEDINREVSQFASSSFSLSSSLAAPLSSLTSTNSKEVLQFPASSISIAAPQAAPVISVSSQSAEVLSSDSTESYKKPSGESSMIGHQAALTTETEADNLASTKSTEKLALSSSQSLNFAHLMPSASSTEVPKALASSPNINKTGTHGTVSNTMEKQSAAVAASPAFPSELGGSSSGKSNVDATVAQEDEMEEEEPETNQTANFSLGSLAGFGIGSAPSATAPKSNPFGGPITSAPQTMPTSISLTVPSGELFRPASFSFQPLQASQPPQPANSGANSGAFGFTNPLQQSSSGSGFGQPSQIGSGQQALGSVLGSFGQSRQLGAGLPGTGFGVPQSPGGGFPNPSAGGGFTSIGSSASGFGSGFATAATAGGGFAAAATGGGGFAAAAPGAGGFAAAAPGAGRFAAAATSGGGFAAAAGGGGFASAGGAAGGFGAFGKTGNAGFSGFGSGTGGRQAPSELFTQMRK